MTRKKRIMSVIIIIFSLLIADHSTKWVAIRCLKESGEVYSFCGDYFRLQYAENTGAFLSLGANLSTVSRTLVMIGFNGLVLGALVCYLVFNKNLQRVSLVSFSLIAGGGIGNLLDRIFRDGCVVDFMNIGIQLKQFSLRTGIFNIADVAIMLGLFLILANEAVTMKKRAVQDPVEGKDQTG